MTKPPSHGTTAHRGEVWWVRLDPTLGSEIRKRRPCLIVGSDVLNERRQTLVVIPLSTAPQAAPPLPVPVACAGRPAVAVIDQIRAVTKERLDQYMGTVSSEEVTSIEEALRLVPDL